jgi:Uma2 family endonuclease
MSVATKIPARMSVTEFLAWCPEDGYFWQLVDGEPMAMAPPSSTHGAIQNEIGRILGNHLLERESSCRVITTPGVTPHVHAKQNVRIPDLAIACSPPAGEDRLLDDPVLVIEILSPSNPAETWANVWTYTSIPSVREILVVSSLEISAELLRRGPDGSWPQSPALIKGGDIDLETIGYHGPLAGFYRTTKLRLSAG